MVEVLPATSAVALPVLVRDPSGFAFHACSLAALPRSSPFVLWTSSQNS